MFSEETHVIDNHIESKLSMKRRKKNMQNKKKLIMTKTTTKNAEHNMIFYTLTHDEGYCPIERKIKATY